MNVQSMALGSYQTNCYLVWGEDSQTCVVIDPGEEARRVLLKVASLGKTIEAIFLTHGHFDHVGAVKELVADTDCRVYLCAEDLSLPAGFTAGPLFYTDTYGEGDVVEAAGLSFRILHTPGHTKGSVCILCGDTMFSGDTLFAGTCGRTDLPGGDWVTIHKSLRRLAELEGEYKVFPGHGESTKLSTERQYNPYIR